MIYSLKKHDEANIRIRYLTKSDPENGEAELFNQIIVLPEDAD